MDVFDLYAKLKLDSSDYDKGLGNAEGMAKSFVSGAGQLLAGFAKVSAAAIGATATGLSAIIGQAVDAYKDYEQLVGGVETLFGAQGKSLWAYANDQGKAASEVREEWLKLEEAQELVLANADKAYATAGMSANEYLSTVTNFSASLIQSLDGDTVEAARIADMAIIDMADNVNRMGTSTEAVENAYKGLAKQNFTMLDNLQLGYQGTAEEMARLINDSGVMGDKFKATADNVKNISFDKYLEAIHAVQTEMHISGATADEAATTIEGSLKMTQASFKNLVAGLAKDNADVKGLVDNLVTSVTAAANNILPRISIAMEGIITLVQNLIPVITAMLPDMVEEFLPPLIDSATMLVEQLVEMLPELLDPILKELPGIATSIIEMIPEIIMPIANDLLPQLVEMATGIIPTLVETITGMLPELLTAGLLIVTTLIQGLAQTMPTMIPQIVAVMTQLVQMFVMNAPLLLDAAKALIQGIADGIGNALPILLDALPVIITGIIKFLTEAIPQMIEMGVQLLTALIKDLPNIITQIVGVLPEIIQGIIGFLTDNTILLVEAGFQLFVALVEALPDIIEAIVIALPQIIDAIIKAISENFDKIAQSGFDLFVSLIKQMPLILAEILVAVYDLINGILLAIGETIEDFIEMGKNLIQGFWDGLVAKWNEMVDAVKGMLSDLKDMFTLSFEFGSPSKLAKRWGGWLAEGFGIGWDKEWDKVQNNINGDLDFTMQPINTDNLFGETPAGAMGGIVYNQTVNVNDKIATPDELAETLRIESRYGLMAGGEIYA